MVDKVCVYCGSSARVDDKFKDSAALLGRVLANHGWTTVYGGASVGLMGILADTVIAEGGSVIGVMSQNLVDYEIDHKGLSEIHIVDTMHKRKQMMVDLSDAFVVLPGGLGTLDEFFELMTWKQIGMHDKPIILVNIDGYWDSMLTMIDGIKQEGFMRRKNNNLFVSVENPEDVVSAIQNAPKPEFDPTTKWI